MEIQINKNERLVVAWADKCHGPGWANTPIWYIVRNSNGVLEQRCLQPDEQTKEMSILFNTNYESSDTLTQLVAMKLKGKK